MHAIEAAAYYLQNEAYVEIIAENLSVGKVEHLRHLESYKDFDFSHLCSSWGKQITGIEERALDFDSYQNLYLNSLIEKMNLQSLLIRGRVDQVSKKSLRKNTDIPLDKRTKDEFLVHSFHKPDMEGEDRSSLNKTILESLESPLDRYGEYDFVVDCTGYSINPGLGHDGCSILGEKYLAKPELLLSGPQAWGYKAASSEERIALIIESVSGLKEAAALADEFEQKKMNQLKVVLVNERLMDSEDFEKIKAIQKSYAGKQHVEYQEKLKKWQTLETYEQAKIPCPQLDTSAFEVYTKMNVMAVHQLIDREGIYLSLEGEKDCTLQLDRIVNMRKMNKQSDPFKWIYAACNVDESEIQEPGFYQIDAKGEDLRLNSPAIELTFKDMLRYFTKAV